MDSLEAGVRALAVRVGREGDGVREAVGRLDALRGLDWQGTAAAEFAVQLADVRRAADAAGRACEEAAAALTAHAGRVAAAEERLQALAPVVPALPGVPA